jgi:hypothetical protein
MKRLMVIVVALIASSAHAQVVATAGRNIVVAHDGRIELFDGSLRRIWTVAGVDHPSKIAVSETRIAVIDSFANEACIADISTGRIERARTGETPVDAVFIGRNLYVLARDAGRLERIGGSSIAVGADPAFMHAVRNRILVYSRLEGTVQEIDPATMRVTRKVVLEPFASDFETDARTGYLVYPHEAKMRTFSLASMTRGNDVPAGAVPVDLAVAARENALSASRLALADPSAKRVWVVEGSQSVTRAVARGFIRGLLGLGLFAPASSDFPTGIDRVLSRGSTTVAYDSTTQTLYRVRGSKGTTIARDVASGSFALTSDGVAFWQDGTLRLIR